MLPQVIRDNFHISTWLMMGAVVQGLVCLLPYRNIALVLPAAIMLFVRALKPIMMHLGIMRNSYASDSALTPPCTIIVG